MLWAKNLAIGYYDHPPMVAWLIKLILFFSDEIVFVRSVAIVSSLLSTYILYLLIKDISDKKNVYFVILLYSLSPLTLLSFLVTNDVPLLLFSLVAILFYSKYLKENREYYILLCGIFLGLAFLSKYLVLPIIFGILLTQVFIVKKIYIKFLIKLALGFLPFFLLHIYYNYNNCWNTIMFHIYNRNMASSLSLESFLSFLIGLPLMITPWLLYGIFQHKPKVKKIEYKLCFLISMTIIVFYFLISFKTVIGLHFYLLLGPYIFALIIFLKKKIQRLFLILTFGYSVTILLGLLVLINFPIEKFANSTHYATIVLSLKPLSVCSKINEFKDYEIYTDYYAHAALLSNKCKKDVKVLFGVSRYGREFDKWFDLNTVGPKILYLKTGGNFENEVEYFGNYKIDKFGVHNASYHYLLSEDFDKKKYKQEFLSKIKETYYQIPDWLPYGKCDII